MKTSSIHRQDNKRKTTSQNPFVIAIGASAGGMEAIHSLFDNTIEDGVAYVIIQHLSPDHKSFMAELLAKHSKLKISVAENNMQVQSNHVYLLPKGMKMTIKQRKLLLSESQDIQPNTAIDIFLDSLAEDQEEKSIAVILSGTGTDGSKGIEAIKRHGGYVIVQDPKSAKFDGMPNSAINSGNADAILAPELIPAEITSYLKQNMLEENFSDQFSKSDEEKLAKVLELIQQHTPLDFSEYKRPTIIRRILLRMTKNKIETLEAYITFLKENPEEISTLSNDLLISVTSFFRDEEAFQLLEKEVIPDIVNNKLQVDTLKVWVVGCATGEEAYSIAILIMEQLIKLKKNLDVKIFASDIDKAALRQASKGIFSATSVKDLSEERIDKFFTKKGNGYQVKESIRKMIIFADHDIVKQPPYGKMDLISCRNLLIYINPVLQKKILSSLHFCLKLGGYLFLGPSENLGEIKKSFIELDKNWRIYKNIDVAKNLRETTYNTPRLDRSLIEPIENLSPEKSIIKANLVEIIQQTLLDESGYEAGVCVDEQFQIVQTFGDYEKYLLPKIFNFNLLEMLPDELSIATSTTLRKAEDQNKMVGTKKVNFIKNDTAHSVDVVVKPFLDNNTHVASVYLVLFSEEVSPTLSKKDLEEFQMDTYTLRHIEDLKNELDTTNQKLQDSYEALDESTNNISSYNEELISSNEELQSTNEELQSVNEELQTVNNEYQLKIKELADLNDELNNYFKATYNGQLYLDNDLVIKKFTPSAIKQINVKESDIGRKISDISTNFKFTSLIDDIHAVISGYISKEKEMQTKDGKWYQTRISPYSKKGEHKNSGAIIEFNDITELKQAQDRLSRLNTDHKSFIYRASHDLKGPISNIKSLIKHLLSEIDPNNSEIITLSDMINSSIEKLQDTISELSDFTKIESEIYDYEAVDIQALIEEAKFNMHDLISKSNASITLDLKEPVISFSKKNMRSVISNLLSNAIKYKSPDRDPDIYITTERKDQLIVLSVKDNGLGIESGDTEEIFTKFKRLHHDIEGSGIGLYLVKRLVTNAGGDIKVESELGKGTTMKVYFKLDPVKQKT